MGETSECAAASVPKPWRLPLGFGGALLPSAAVRAGLTVLIVGLRCASLAQPTNRVAAEFETVSPDESSFQSDWLRVRAKETQEHYRLRVAIPDAVTESSSVNGSAGSAGNDLAVPSRQQPPEEGYQNLLLGVVLFAVGLLAVRKLAFPADDPVYIPLSSTFPSSTVLAEDRAFTEFLVAFKAGPSLRSRLPQVMSGSRLSEKSEEGKDFLSRMELDPVKRFFLQAPEHLRSGRKLLQQVGGGPTEAVRQTMLADLCGQVRSVKGMAGLPELVPIWQLASALEGLLKQLAEQARKVTPSTLRTAANGLDLLDDLCKRAPQSDLFTNPPVRFLSVDDDAISRHAVCFSLKKAFNQPDVAASGDAALALTSKLAYDVIFLDVQMPGMDGFELCSKIRETDLNHSTPVVFVTCQNDFDMRAKSSLCGGNDFLGKPFLIFEITVKALTLALGARLRAGDRAQNLSDTILQGCTVPAVSP